MILYVASDLLWATRIRSTADSLQIPARPARNLDMLRARFADSPVRALIVDLEAPEAVDLIRAAKGLSTRSAGPQAPTSHHPVRILAFGPHVAVDRFHAAREAGADEVLARGAFDRRLPDLLRELSITRDDDAAPGTTAPPA